MGTRCKTAATPPTTMNRTSWRVRTSISLRNRFSNSRHTFSKLMHLLECLQTLERGVPEASTHETSIDAVVVVLFARWRLVFEVFGHALHLTRSGRPSSPRTSLPRAAPWTMSAICARKRDRPICCHSCCYRKTRFRPAWQPRKLDTRSELEGR